MEYGMRKGLAQVLDWRQRSDDDRYNANLQRQAKIQAEQKAKMFADDFDYNNAMNPHDNPLVKKYAMGKLMEIGSFMRQNSDWETDPFKRAVYKSKIHELKDNPDLNRGLTSDANFKSWQEDMSKNGDEVDPSEWEGIHEQWNNYLKYGHQKGAEAASQYGKQAFTYEAPKDIDYNEYLRKIANDTKFDTTQASRYGYQSGYKQLVSDKARSETAGFATTQRNKFTMKMMRDYQREGGDEKNGNFQAWTRRKMDPFFKEAEYHLQTDPNYAHKSESGGEPNAFDAWNYDTNNAIANPNTPIKASIGGVSNLMQDHNGRFNFKSGYLKQPNGNKIDIKDFVTKNATTSGSKMVYNKIPGQDGPGKLAISATVKMPVEQFKTLFSEYYDNQSWINPADWGDKDSFSEADNPTKNIFKQYDDVDDKGDKQTFVEFDVWQDYDPRQRSHAPAYNFGADLNKEKSTSDSPNQIGIGDDGYVYRLDANGNAMEKLYKEK